MNFDGVTGGTATIRASYNVSSVTRNSAGNYTVNFTNALADANYAGLVTASSGTTAGRFSYGPVATPTTTTWQLVTSNTAGTPTDLLYVNVVFVR